MAIRAVIGRLRRAAPESPGVIALLVADIGPLDDTSSFSFTRRVGRFGPITVLDIDFHDDVWVNGGELRPHYHVTLPVASSSAATDADFSVTA